MQFADERQTVPVASGKVMVLAAVAALAKVVKKLVVPVNCKLPLLAMTNLVAPDLDAVNKSPVPELSVTSVAKELLAETDAE